MKKSINYPNIKKWDYSAPAIDICNTCVEKGFSASVPGVSILPWGSDNDSLEL